VTHGDFDPVCPRAPPGAEALHLEFLIDGYSC
jgi:hypothetical protein